MLRFVIKRVLGFIPTMIIISFICFIIIQLPPGDFLSFYIGNLLADGSTVAMELVETMRARYGLDAGVMTQYFTWIRGFPRGDFGFSMMYGGASAMSVFWPTVGPTVVIILLALLLSLVIGVPIGIYSATHPYGLIDYTSTGVAFLGLATPEFISGLVLSYVYVTFFGGSVGGLQSIRYIGAPMSIGKALDFLSYTWIAIVVLGFRGMATVVRIMRANMLDILEDQYIKTARAKGLRESVVIWKHAVRIAINPLISRLGNQIPRMISQAIVISIVLSIPTSGYLFYRALLAQDMYLAGVILMGLVVLLLIGNLIVDISLALLDPRISYE